jgi:hypothetical protein
MAFKMKGSPMQRNFGIGTSFKQTDEDLKEYLIDEKGMTPKDADEQIADGAHSTSDEEFLAWYKENKKGGEEEAAPAEGEGGGGEEEAMQAMMGMMGGAGGESPMMLTGKQKNLDKNNNNKIDAEDFKMMYKKDSAMKNYMNPQDYKVFNMGNKPSPNKLDLKRVTAGIKGAVKGALANEGKSFPGMKRGGAKYPGSDIIQGFKGGVAIYDRKKKKKSKKG